MSDIIEDLCPKCNTQIGPDDMITSSDGEIFYHVDCKNPTMGSKTEPSFTRKEIAMLRKIDDDPYQQVIENQHRIVAEYQALQERYIESGVGCRGCAINPVCAKTIHEIAECMERSIEVKEFIP